MRLRATMCVSKFRRGSKLLDARTEQDHTYAGQEKRDGECRGNLRRSFSIDRGVEWPELGHLFLPMIGEDRMHQPHNAADEQQDAEDDHEALHAAPKKTGLQSHPRAALAQRSGCKPKGDQERPAAAAGGAAFFAAFAAAEALRRRLVFGGV